MKNFRAADKSHAGGDEKHDINFHWPKLEIGLPYCTVFSIIKRYISHFHASIFSNRKQTQEYLVA